MSNRLAEQTSPYLRIHAQDPVDWYPWGDEALSAAKASGKPIFLSIGYASCHWCHVMHRESFKDPAIAEVLNERFISVKVDRESRPDVDELYMAYVVAANGHGGWPMSVFLTPDLVPVVGGTYFPPARSYGVPSFREVLDQVYAAFSERSAEVSEASGEALGYLQAMFTAPKPGTVDREVIEKAARTFIGSADAKHGGFGKAPKFPQAPITDFLLDYHALSGDARALAVVEMAAECMVRGGIYDQAGGGIARYATDAAWLIPHFEKMLYDNGMLLSTLAKLHAVAPREEWAHAMRQTAEFCERDLATPSGLFASSRSADTEGVEGKTYVWTHEELAEVLDEDELAIAEECLGVTRTGNWEGTNILTRPDGRDARADEVDAVLGKLFEARQHRPQPDLDEKVIVAWNALAARGFVAAGAALGDGGLLQRGVELTRMLFERCVDGHGGVLRILGDPTTAEVRLLDDAAGLAVAALEAAEQTDDAELRQAAKRIMDTAIAAFYDGDGTWFMTAEQTELPVRPREQHDSPLPSGPSLAAVACLRLAGSFAEGSYRDAAVATLRRQATMAERSPFAVGTALSAMTELVTHS